MKIKLLPVIALMGASVMPAQQPFIRAGVVGLSSPGKVTVPSTPISFRNLGIHPEDTHVPPRNAGIIPDGPVYAPGPKSFAQVRASGGILFRRGIDVSLGGYAAFNQSSYQNCIGDATRERAYSGVVGSPNRGEGAALTYVCAKSDANNPTLGIFGDIAVPVFKSSGLRIELFGRAEQELTASQNISITAGYDRFNVKEEELSTQLASIRSTRLPAGIRLNINDILHIDLGAGPERQSISGSINGSSDTKIGWRFSVTSGYLFNR